MKINSFYILLMAVSTTIIVACKQSGRMEDVVEDKEKSEHTGQLIKIDFNDTTYRDLILYAADTSTRGGWTVTYLVRDDSTRYTDIYIQCRKGKLSAIYKGSGLLQLRRYFIPVLAGESESYIYFSHACATECAALLVFSKEKPEWVQDFQNVVDYDVKSDQILYATDTGKENKEGGFAIALVDLVRDTTCNIAFEGICEDYSYMGCMDTVIFNSGEVIIKAKLHDKTDSHGEKPQTKRIVLSQQ